MHKVFVYGTLKRGFNNYTRLLTGPTTKFIGPAVTDGKFKMLDSGFPVLLTVQSGGKRVAGEVFEVDHATLANLDRLEGEGSMYDRKVVTVEMSDGSFVQASTYIGCEHWRTSDYAEPWRKTNAAGHWDWGR